MARLSNERRLPFQRGRVLKVLFKSKIFNTSEINNFCLSRWYFIILHSMGRLPDMSFYLFEFAGNRGIGCFEFAGNRGKYYFCT